MAAIAITVFRDIGALSSPDIHPPCVMLGPRSEWRLNALQRKCGDCARATDADTSCFVTPIIAFRTIGNEAGVDRRAREMTIALVRDLQASVVSA